MNIIVNKKQYDILKKILEKSYSKTTLIVENQDRTNKQQLLLGRFQPFTIGHKKMVEIQKQYQDTVYLVVVEGKKSSMDKKRNPFTFEERKEFIKKVFPESSVIVEKYNIGYLPDIINFLEEKYKIPVGYVFCGEDRIESYKRQLEKLNDEHIDIEFIITPRVVQQSTFRKLVLEGNFEEQMKLLPDELKKEFEYIVERLLIVNSMKINKNSMEEGKMIKESNNELNNLKKSFILNSNQILNYDFIKRIYNDFIINKQGNSFSKKQKLNPDKYIPKVQKELSSIVYIRFFVDERSREFRQMQNWELLKYIYESFKDKQDKIILNGFRIKNDSSSQLPSLKRMKNEYIRFIKDQLKFLKKENEFDKYKDGISLKELFEEFIEIKPEDSGDVKSQKFKILNILKNGYIGQLLTDRISNKFVQILMKPQITRQGSHFQIYDETKIQILIKFVLELLRENKISHNELKNVKEQQIKIRNLLTDLESLKKRSNINVMIKQEIKISNDNIDEIIGYSVNSGRQIDLERQVQIVGSIHPSSIKNIDLVIHESQNIFKEIKNKVDKIFKKYGIHFNKDKWNPQDIQLCNSKKIDELLNIKITDKILSLQAIEIVNERFKIEIKNGYYYNSYDFYGISLKKIGEFGQNEQRFGKQSPFATFGILLGRNRNVFNKYKGIYNRMLDVVKKSYENTIKKLNLSNNDVNEKLKNNEFDKLENLINEIQKDLSESSQFNEFRDLLKEQDTILNSNDVYIERINMKNVGKGKLSYVLGETNVSGLDKKELFTPKNIQSQLLKQIVYYNGEFPSLKDPVKTTIQSMIQIMQLQVQVIQSRKFQDKVKSQNLSSNQFIKSLEEVIKKSGKSISLEFQYQWDFLVKTQGSQQVWSQNYLKVIGEGKINVKRIQFNERKVFLIDKLSVNTKSMHNIFTFKGYSITDDDIEFEKEYHAVLRFFNILSNFTFELLNEQMILNNQNDKETIMEGITHIDDLEVKEFINWVRDIIYNNEPLMQSIKFDGVQNINIVYKDGKIYQQRFTKGKRELIDDPYKWSKSPIYNGLITQTQFILEFYKKHKNIFDKYFHGKGEYVFDCEVVSPWFQNTIKYDFDTGVVILYRPLGENFDRETFDKISKELQNQPSMKIQNYIYVLDENTLKIKKELFESEWKFKEDEIIDLKKYITDKQREHIEKELKELEKFLNTKIEGTSLTFYDILRYKGRDKEMKELKNELLKQQKEYVNGIKGLLLEYLNKQIEQESEQDIEGIVFRKGEDLVKLVDKNFFRELNEFYWKYIELLDRGQINKKTGEKVDGILTELKKKQSKLLDFNLLRRGLKKEINEMEGNNTNEKIQNFLIKYPELTEKQRQVKDKLIQLIDEALNKLQILLDDFVDKYNKGELKIKIKKSYSDKEKEYKYSEQVFKRTKEQILLKIQLFKRLKEELKKVKNDGVQILFLFLRFVLFYDE